MKKICLSNSSIITAKSTPGIYIFLVPLLFYSPCKKPDFTVGLLLPLFVIKVPPYACFCNYCYDYCYCYYIGIKVYRALSDCY